MGVQAVLVELAQGVADALNGPTFTRSIEFEADREWAPIFDRSDLKDPTVTVVPDVKRISNASRGKKLNEVTIDITLRRFHGATEDSPAMRDKCDALGALAQEIEDFLMGTNDVSGQTIATENLKATPTASDLYHNRDDLLTNRCVTMVVSIGYKLMR